MTHRQGNDGKFDDVDLYGVFSSDSLKVPDELDRLILNAAEAEVSKTLPVQEDSTEVYRNRGLSGVWAQAFAVAAIVVGAVILVPLLSHTDDTQLVADASTVANETASLAETEFLRDADVSSVDSDASVDFTIENGESGSTADRNDESTDALANDSAKSANSEEAENLEPLASGGSAGIEAIISAESSIEASDSTPLRMAESDLGLAQEEAVDSKKVISDSSRTSLAASPTDRTDVDDITNASTTQTNDLDTDRDLAKEAEADVTQLAEAAVQSEPVVQASTTLEYQESVSTDVGTNETMGDASEDTTSRTASADPDTSVGLERQREITVADSLAGDVPSAAKAGERRFSETDEATTAAGERSSELASGASDAALSPEISAFPAPAAKAREANLDSIIKARVYRKTEKLWIEEIAQLHENGDATQVRTELIFFKLVHSDSEQLKKLLAEILEDANEK